jgi:hypothetical protein
MEEIEHILVNPVFVPKVVRLNDKEFSQMWKKLVKEDNVDKFMDCMEKNMLPEMKEKMMEDVFFYIFEQKEIKTGILEKFISNQKYIEFMDKMIDTIDDYSLDIANLHKKVLKIIELKNTLKNEEWKEKIYKTMRKEESDDDWEKMADEDDDDDFNISRFS